MLAAAAVLTASPHRHPQPFKFDRYNQEVACGSYLPCSSHDLLAEADTSVSPKIICSEVVESILREENLIPDRRSITTDNSVVFEFITSRQACVDVYPNGEIVIILRENGVDNIYELDLSNRRRMINLLSHAKSADSLPMPSNPA